MDVIAGFMFGLGIVYIVATTLVLIFKRETGPSRGVVSVGTEANPAGGEETELGILGTYAILAKILALKPMPLMVAFLLTSKIASGATDAMTDLKFIDVGVGTDKIASRRLFLIPQNVRLLSAHLKIPSPTHITIQIVLPWVICSWTAGKKPLNVFLWAYPIRVAVCILLAALIHWTPFFRDSSGEYPYYWYALWIGAHSLQEATVYATYLSAAAFCAQVADPAFGGTYMTLLMTLGNLGWVWPITLFLSVTDLFNSATVSGYYVSVGIATVVGGLWYGVFYPRIRYLQAVPREEWLVGGRK